MGTPYGISKHVGLVKLGCSWRLAGPQAGQRRELQQCATTSRNLIVMVTSTAAGQGLAKPAISGDGLPGPPPASLSDLMPQARA